MLLYRLAVILHVLAMALWIGHMLVWSLVTGPALKKVEPPATAELLRARSLELGGLGWPALAILVVTGLYLLTLRGIGVVDGLLGEAGWPLALKLWCVVGMIAYQALVGHRQAGVAIYANIALALVVLACSTVLVRGA
jgi:uncharacterized membrane protein